MYIWYSSLEKCKNVTKILPPINEKNVSLDPKYKIHKSKTSPYILTKSLMLHIIRRLILDMRPSLRVAVLVVEDTVDATVGLDVGGDLMSRLETFEDGLRATEESLLLALLFGCRAFDEEVVDFFEGEICRFWVANIF